MIRDCQNLIFGKRGKGVSRRLDMSEKKVMAIMQEPYKKSSLTNFVKGFSDGKVRR